MDVFHASVYPEILTPLTAANERERGIGVKTGGSNAVIDVS